MSLNTTAMFEIEAAITPVDRLSALIVCLSSAPRKSVDESGCVILDRARAFGLFGGVPQWQRSLQTIELNLLVLLGVAALVAWLAHRSEIPYAIGLVIAGLALGNLTTMSGPALTKDLLFLVVLPGLLFEGAFALEFSAFWQTRYAVLMLAVPGLILSSIITSLILWLSLNRWDAESISFREALAFGALIAATDPVSVLSLFRSLGVNARLAALLEAESLFNDGTAVVVFSIVLGLGTQGEIGWGMAIIEFLRVAGGAVFIGALVGIAAGLLTRTIDDPLIEMTFTVLAAYGAFIAAESLQLSGVIASVIAGLVSGTWGSRGMTPATQHTVQSFWRYASFLLNSMVFLLIGTQISLPTLWHYAAQIAIAWVAMTLARAAIVFGHRALLKSIGSPVDPLSWSTALVWGGLRGGLSMVLALALPASFRHRELVLNLTYGTVLLTLLVQGLTIKPLMHRLGLTEPRAEEA